QQRPGMVELEDGRRALVDDGVEFAPVAMEDQRIECHIDRDAIELLALNIEAELRSQLDRPGSAMGDSILETRHKHGPGHALDPRSKARSDNFGRLAHDPFAALMEDMKLHRLRLRRLQQAHDMARLQPNLPPEVQ